jgi:two-component system phosphate regulon sensor histidine kinase PhoR
MFTSPHLWRTAATYVLFVLAGVGLLVLFSLGEISQNEELRSEQQLRAHAATLAVAISPSLTSGDRETLASTAQVLSTNTGLRVTIIDDSGIVLIDTLENPSALDNHLRRPEVQTAINRGEGIAERYSQTLKENYHYLAVPIRSADGLIGVVRVARSRTELEKTILDAQLHTLLFATGIIAILALVALVVAWRRAAVMEEITQITEAIAQGDFDRRVAESKAVGMKRLADAINQMARNSASRVSVLTSDRNRLATVFTGMVEGVIDVDEKQNTLHINEAAASMLGVERDKCIGKPVWHVTRHQKITQALDEALRQRTVIKTQVDYALESHYLVMDIYVASLSDDQGEPIGAVVVMHNVTELKNLERVRTDFVANASHELKTPITAIRGLSETVVGDPAMDKTTALHFMERIHAQSIRLSHLVSDLMTISRLESDQNISEFTLLNFGELINRALNTAETAIENKRHTLVASLPEVKLEVVGDRQQLSQLADNLLDNAIKYTPEGGRIKVKVYLQGATAVFEVEDSGIGISPQYQQRVFERFYRVDKARSQSLGGTGLGLSIVKNIAERHGGVVSVSSQLGRGSVFSYRMPAAHQSHDLDQD